MASFQDRYVASARRKLTYLNPLDNPDKKKSYLRAAWDETSGKNLREAKLGKEIKEARIAESVRQSLMRRKSREDFKAGAPGYRASGERTT